MTMISTAGVVRRVQKKAPGRYKGVEAMALENRIREFLLIRKAVEELEAEYQQRLHTDIMEDINGYHGQG